MNSIPIRIQNSNAVSNVKAKEKARNQIQADIDAFLASDNKIERLEVGASAYKDTIKPHGRATSQRNRERNRKFTVAQVREIKSLLPGKDADGITVVSMCNSLARKYGVSYSTIRAIYDGRNWKDIV